MNVLGIFGFGMNPAACLLRDGELVAFCEEERFSRVKTSPDQFPGRAVQFCLSHAELDLGDVDRIAFAWDTHKYPFLMLKKLAGQYARHRSRAQSGGGRSLNHSSTLSSALLNVLKYTPGRLEREIQLGLRERGIKGAMPKIEFVPHHLCHAYSTFFASPFDEALILTLDGSGEDICTQIAVGRAGKVEIMESTPIPHSLGWYYAAFTAYFGFLPYRHEGKLMGLAGLGHARADGNPWVERLEPVLTLDDSGYRVDPTFTRFGVHSHAERFTDKLVKLITSHDPKLTPVSALEDSQNAEGPPPRYLDPAYVDLAWGVQARLEHVVRELAKRAAHKHGGHRNLCIAGGVGLNCKLNGALLSTDEFDGVFVQPASNDAGSALGAAMAVAEAAGDKIQRPLEHVNYGPEFGNAELRDFFQHCKVPAYESSDITTSVAEELARGKLVGWFQGRAEFGPRALGSRSILASPYLENVSDRLNLAVKGREPWRPFCPSILAEDAPDYFEGCTKAPFMTTAFQVKEEKRKDLAAATHVDGSARPQTVSESATPLFHQLLCEFRDRTGLPALINTSFNFAGEPIVSSPRDALRVFYSTGLDVLAIGDFILRKPPLD